MKRDNDINREFLKVYEELADPLFRHCCYKISNREKALDLVQEAFTRTWEYLAEGKKIIHLKSFVYRTANNLIIDEYRKKKTDSLDFLLEGGFDPGEDESARGLLNSSETRLALEGIQKLSALYREVMELRYVAGLSIGEIAEIISESENTVSVRLTRGAGELRKILNIGHGA